MYNNYSKGSAILLSKEKILLFNITKKKYIETIIWIVRVNRRYIEIIIWNHVNWGDGVKSWKWQWQDRVVGDI